MDISNSITNIQATYNNLNKLKIRLRPFHTSDTKNKLANLDNELVELTEKKQKLTQQIGKLETQLNDVEKFKEQSQSTLNELKEQQEKLKLNIESTHSKNEDLAEKITKSEKQTNDINKIKAQVDSQQEVVSNFVEKINIREQQLDEQTAKANNFDEKLLAFTDEREDLLITARNLVKEAKHALGYKKAEGIAAAFQKRLNKLEPEGGNWSMRVLKSVLNPRFGWILGAAFFSIAAIGISADFIKSVQEQGRELTFILLLARLSIVILPIAGAWFCAGQYTKLKNIAEDYAYKTVLAQSIIGFSEQLKNDDPTDTSYQDYMKKMLDEIHQHPLDNHKKSVKKEKTTPINKL